MFFFHRKKSTVICRESQQQKFSLQLGFRHVIDILSSEKKLIVGHNCLLGMLLLWYIIDVILPCLLCHLLLSSCRYCTYMLQIGEPSSFIMVDFAKLVHKHFPSIVDTKHLINVNRAIQYLMKRSSKWLSSAFSLLCPKISCVKVEVETDETNETGYVFMLSVSILIAPKHIFPFLFEYSVSIFFSLCFFLRIFYGILLAL